MPKPSRFDAGADGADAVERAFYDALQAGDLEGVMACWSDSDECICVHPGGARWVGASAIRGTYTSILGDGGLKVWPEQVRRVACVDAAVHSVVERVQVMTSAGLAHAFLLATNIYRRTADGWRLVLHHASPGDPEPALEGGAPPVLH